MTTTHTSDATDARARTLANRIHARLATSGVDLPVRLWDGTELGPVDPDFRLVLTSPSALRTLLLDRSDLAVGEAFTAGLFDVEGSMVAALETVVASELDHVGIVERLRLAADVLRLPRPSVDVVAPEIAGRLHDPDRDAAAVRSHYDVGNDFYATFLDERLVYSCAYFADGDDDLDRAQERKLELICRKLALREGERMLDIGCGWGALALHAAQHFGVTVVGVTLAHEQAALARERVAAAGLADRVEIRVADYREVTGTFDAVASVGMFEHVGADELDRYFATCRRLTGPGGRFLNHGITTGRRDRIRDLGRDRDNFVARYVFPDGALVPAWRAVQGVQRAGFEVLDLEQLRPHYARTLRHWVARLEAHADEARAAADERILRIWRAYMAGSAVGFTTGDLGVVQVLGTVGANLPRGRAWMLPQRPAPEDARPG